MKNHFRGLHSCFWLISELSQKTMLAKLAACYQLSFDHPIAWFSSVTI